MNTSIIRVWWMTVLCATPLAACNSGSSVSTRARTIGPDGGTASATNEDQSLALLTVPAGAVAESTEMSIAPYPIAALAAPSGADIVEVWIITPHGLTFSTPATLTIQMGTVPSGNVVIGRLEDETDVTWEFLGNSELSGNALQLSLSSLSIYAVMTGADGDNDGVPNEQDAFPTDPAESVDTDGDGVGDNGDSSPTDGTQCGDSDSDTCDDCASGSLDATKDGTDSNADGLCDACDAATCGSSGTCSDASGSLTCNCSGGYAGIACDSCDAGFQDNNADGACVPVCDVEACSGHGTCDDASGAAVCTCQSAYMGDECSSCAQGFQDNDANGDCQPDCTGNDCSGRGACDDASGMAVCECNSGYTGADCSGCDEGFQDRDANGVCELACNAGTCSGHGTCDDASGTATCRCNTGRTGTDCSSCDVGYQDNDANGDCRPDCTGNDCSSHGTCGDASGTATCSCDTEYTGADCSSCAVGYQDNDSDGTCAADCATANPSCSGNGTCDDTSGAAVCDCDPGWTGADCSTPVGPPPSYSFTDCTQTGPSGPSQVQCDASYMGTLLDGSVTVDAGYQLWTVPTTGSYQITAHGAEGGTTGTGNTPGAGAEVSGVFTLTAGEQLVIAVGQPGTDQADNGSCSVDWGGGGGGATFVTRVQTGGDTITALTPTRDVVPLVVAGGGAGNADTEWIFGEGDCVGVTAPGGRSADGASTGAGADGGGDPVGVGGGYAGSGPASEDGRAFLSGAQGQLSDRPVPGGFGGGGSGYNGGGSGGGYQGGETVGNPFQTISRGGYSFVDGAATGVTRTDAANQASGSVNIDAL